MDRIAPVTPPYSDALAARFARLLPPGMTPPTLFRAVARNEGLFTFLVDSGLIGPTGLLDRHLIPNALREALILRTCAACDNRYEWQLHVGTIARRMGLNDAQIADTWSGRPDAALWPAQTRALFELVDALVARRPIDAALRERLAPHADEPLLIEVTQLVGLYAGVAMLVALIRPETDAYGAPLPPQAEKKV